MKLELLEKDSALQALRSYRSNGSAEKDFGAFLVDEAFVSGETLEELLRAQEELDIAGQPGAVQASSAGRDGNGQAHFDPEAPSSTSRPAADPGNRQGAMEQSNEPDASSASVAPVKLDYHVGVSLEDLLREACALGVSDIHLHSGASMKVRIHGQLQDATEVIDPDAAKDLLYGLLTEDQRSVFEGDLQLDFAFQIPSVGRFRSNAYHQQRGVDAVFRAIPPVAPSLEDLGLPASLGDLADLHQGIVLFTGPAGCGKSSTMAAVVREVSARRRDHILMIEDPIEFEHQAGGCVVNQRQVGPHTESFARALRAALREDPDVIVIGELRDLETISLALTAAETGHLVLATLHTSGAVRTLNRILGVFPPDQQSQIRTMFSESLRAVVSQRLVLKADGSGRIPAMEILPNTKAIANLIRDNKTYQIISLMQTGGDQGMRLLDNSLAELVKARVISKEEASLHAEVRKFA